MKHHVFLIGLLVLLGQGMTPTHGADADIGDIGASVVEIDFKLKTHVEFQAQLLGGLTEGYSQVNLAGTSLYVSTPLNPPGGAPTLIPGTGFKSAKLKPYERYQFRLSCYQLAGENIEFTIPPCYKLKFYDDTGANFRTLTENDNVYAVAGCNEHFDDISEVELVEGGGVVEIATPDCGCHLGDSESPSMVADGMSIAFARVKDASGNVVSWEIEGGEDLCRIEPINDGNNYFPTAIIHVGKADGSILESVKIKAVIEGGCKALGSLELCGQPDEDCASGDCGEFGSANMGNQQGPDISFSMGRASTEYGAGSLDFKFQGNPGSSSIASASNFSFKGGLANTTNPRVISTSNDKLLQVKVPQGLVNIVESSNGNIMTMDFYSENSNTFTYTNGLWVPNGFPWLTWKFEKKASPSYGDYELEVTQIIYATSTSTSHHYYWFNSIEQWAFVDPLEDRVWVSYETTGVGGVRTIHKGLHARGQGATLVGALEYQFQRSYAPRAGGPFENVTSEVEGAGGDARTTTYNYYPSGSGTFNSYELQSVTYPDGTWEYFTYTKGKRVLERYQPYGTLISPQATNTGTQKMTYDYTLSGSSDNPNFLGQLPRVETTYIDGQETARLYREVTLQTDTYTVYEESSPDSGLPFGDSNNVTSKYVYHYDDFYSNRPAEVTHANGTMTFFGYGVPTSDGSLEMMVSSGVPNGSFDGITDGEKTVTILNAFGHPKQYSLFDISSGSSTLMDQRMFGNEDWLLRPTTVTYLDTRTESVSYDCCGLESRTDKDGVQSSYEYDDLKRIKKITVDPFDVSLELYYDAADRLTLWQRVSSSQTTQVLGQADYNTAGLQTTSINALNGTTTISESLVGNALKRTVTYPDTGQRVEEYFRDGRLRKISGTASFPVRYEYGVESLGGKQRRFTKEIKLTSNGIDTQEWTKTYFDGLGNQIHKVYAGSGAPYEEWVYNEKNQLIEHRDEDNLFTLYKYNPEGELLQSVNDVDHNKLIHESGLDRIQEVETDVSTYSGYTVRRQRHRVYGTLYNGTSTLVSETQVSNDGNRIWRTLYRDTSTPVTTSDVTTFNTSSNTRYQTITYPDATQLVREFQHGRLVKLSQKASNGITLTEVQVQYNDHGLPYKLIDSRNGEHLVSYNNADLIASVSTPHPGTGVPDQTTVYGYDTSLRNDWIKNPELQFTYNEYHKTGQLKKIYGALTYPSQYTYDGQGRLITLDTWQNHAGQSGKSTTRWNYDPYRGWLTSKDFPDSTTGLPPGTPGTGGPVYVYTDAGRLDQRIWNRGVNVSYDYDFENPGQGKYGGDLVSVTYSDSTESLSYTFDRRGRVQTVNQGGTDTTTLTYNNINQVLTESFSGGPLGNYSLENVVNSHLKRSNFHIKYGGATRHSAAYAYHATSGRLNSVSTGARSATYSYVTHSDLVSSINFGGGTSTTKLYDFLNRQTQMTTQATGGTLSRDYTYNDLNQREKSTSEDLSYWNYDYDDLGQLDSGKRYWSDHQPVAGQQFTYDFDDIGNRQVTARGGDNTGNNLRTSTWLMNRLNQYDSRTVPAVADIVGTATSSAEVMVNGQVAERHGTYFHAEAGLAPRISRKISASSDQDGLLKEGYLYTPTTPEGFTYDADGNLLTDGRWTYEWDAENRLIRMTKLFPSTDPVTPKIEFEYDYLGRRIAKKIFDSVYGVTPVETIGFIYDGWNLVATTDGGSNLALTYVYGSDLSGTVRGAAGVGGLLMVQDETSSSGAAWFVANNGKGDVIGLVNADTGSIDARYEYGPFGEAIRVEGTAIAFANRVRFSSKWSEEESGLVYYGYRYYQPELGRWLNRDPLGEYGGISLYAFGPNSPVNGFDDLGGMWSVPGMPGLNWGNPFAPSKPLENPADDLDKWIVNIAICCEGGISKLGADNPLLVPILTGTYILQECAHDVVDVARIGQSVSEDGVGGIPDEVGRVASIGGGGFVAKKLFDKIGAACGAVCRIITKRVEAKDAKDAIDKATNTEDNLFRIVDENELADILDSGQFRTVPGMFEGKQFVDNLHDAQALQKRFSEFFGGKQTIVGARAPQSILDNASRVPFSDIPNGTAITVPVDDLTKVIPNP